jgi:hypothetical protein
MRGQLGWRGLPGQGWGRECRRRRHRRRGRSAGWSCWRRCPYTVDADPNGDWKAPDLAKARALVSASGTEGEPVEVWTFAYFGKEARYFVSLLDRLGYHARLKEIPSGGRYFPALDRTPSVQAGFGGWFGIFVAADMFETLHCGASTNWARFCDPRIEAEVRRLTREESTNPSADASLAAKIDRQLVAQAPGVPLFTPRLADFVSRRVGNYQTNTDASSTVLLDQLWVCWVCRDGQRSSSSTNDAGLRGRSSLSNRLSSFARAESNNTSSGWTVRVHDLTRGVRCAKAQRPRRRQTTQPLPPPDRPHATSQDRPTIDYIERRVREGKSRREATRCLKRYLARNLYRLLEHPPATAWQT